MAGNYDVIVVDYKAEQLRRGGHYNFCQGTITGNIALFCRGIPGIHHNYATWTVVKFKA